MDDEDFSEDPAALGGPLEALPGRAMTATERESGGALLEHRAERGAA